MFRRTFPCQTAIPFYAITSRSVQKIASPWISEDWNTDLCSYIGGIVRGQKGKLIEIGGQPDHLHLLFSMWPDQALSEMLRQIKSDSSKWIHGHWIKRRAFHWQTGYGGFTVSRSAEERIAKYIRNQDAHHRKMSFQEEFIKLLKAHGVDYDERYIWLWHSAALPGRKNRGEGAWRSLGRGLR